MKNSKLSILLIFGISLLLLVIGFFLIFNEREVEFVDNAPTAKTGNDWQNTTKNPQSTTSIGVQIARHDGSLQTVRDFRTDTSVEKWYGNEDVWLLGEDVVNGDPLYEIFYYTLDNSIGVSLLQIPLGFARSRAESDLLKKLGVTATEACALTIVVTTPVFVSEEMSGRNLGLDFCPGSVQLE